MPSRWLVPITGIDAHQVKLEHLHAVACSWFDDTDRDDHGPVAPHRNSPKPWSIAPLQLHDDVAVVQCSTHTDAVATRLRTRVRRGRAVRFGPQIGRVSDAPHPVARSSWQQLATPTGHRAWSIRFLTPTTFRSGNRFSPWPDPFAVIRSLSARWAAHAGDQHPLPTLPPTQLATIWIATWPERTKCFRWPT